MNIVDYETDEGNEDHEKYKKELESRGFTPAQFLERKRKARQAGGANKAQMFEACYQPQADPNLIHLPEYNVNMDRCIWTQNHSCNLVTVL